MYKCDNCSFRQICNEGEFSDLKCEDIKAMFEERIEERTSGEAKSLYQARND